MKTTIRCYKYSLEEAPFLKFDAEAPSELITKLANDLDWLFERAEETDRKNNNRNGGKHDGKF